MNKRILEKNVQAQTKTTTIMVSLFKNLSSSASKAVDFDSEIERIVKHDADTKEKTEAYRQMKRAVGKKEADAQIKQKVMLACSIAVLFNGAGKRLQHILKFTSLAFCDLDELKDVETAFRKVAADPHTRMVYRTVGNEGLRIIYRYVREDANAPIDATSWRAAFQKGNSHYAALVGKDYDNQCADYSHLCGLAHDENVYVNHQAEAFVITDEEIVKANMADGRGVNSHKDYPTDSFSTSVEEVWPKVERMLQKKDIIFQSGNHHDFVMHASFLFNRFGVDMDELLEWAEGEWADYNGRQRESTIRSCYRHSDEHGTWKLRAKGGKKDKAELITLPEIAEWVKKKYDLKYNEVTDLTYCRLKGTEEWKTADTRIICTIRRMIAEETGLRILKNDVQDIIWSDVAPMVNPVRDYFKGLSKWDGTDRFVQLASYVTVEPAQDGQSQEEAQLLFAEFFHKWHLGNVGQWLKDSVVNHQMLILAGPQGIYKTTFFRCLLPPELRQYYWENTHNSFRSKDDHIALGENLLVEVEEFNITKPEDVGIMKSLITAKNIKERRPYARQREEKHRLAGFCGTCNDQHFLTDDTGNRRFLCFLVSSIVHPDEWNIDMEQLYAQLRDEFLSGERYWLNREEEERMALQNDAFRLVSDEEMLVLSHFRKPQGNEPFDWMNSASIAQAINGGRLGYGLSTKKVGTVLKRLKYPFSHSRAGNVFGVVKIEKKQLQADLKNEIEEAAAAPFEPQEGELPF